MDMILPKGFVENTSEIYAEIASYPVVPPEKIFEYWNVYTTTSRRLVDPTAFRLENFWWHVWGSDRRYLSGPRLAKLFEEFSKGPTVRPLRSTANRYEGPSIPRARRRSPKKPATAAKAPETFDHSQEDSSSSKSNPKRPTPSSSRPPPAHPILKNSRGPSSSRPRPTARFAVPDDSVDEDGKDDEGLSSGSIAVSSTLPPAIPENGENTAPAAATNTSTTTGVSKMPPPPKPRSTRREKISAGKQPDTRQRGAGEKGPAPTRRIVASTATKRRPVIPRRASSHSSQGSETGSHRSASTMVAAARPKAPMNLPASARAGSQELTSSSSQTSESSGLSMKALGKRPLKPWSAPPQEEDEQPPQPESLEQALTVPPPQRRSTWDTTLTSKTTPDRGSGTRRPPPPVAGFVADRGGGAESVRAPPMVRTLSNTTTAVSTMTATAQGLTGTERVRPTPVFSTAQDIPSNRRPSSSTLELFTPTPPNPAPPIPFGRTKSQLALLLERKKPEGR